MRHKTVPNFDPKCLELAAHFIDNSENPRSTLTAAKESLACAIQSAIEDWFENAYENRRFAGKE